MQGNIWQGLLDYARIAWRKALKEFKKSTYDDVLAKFDIVGGVDLSIIDPMIELCGMPANAGLVNHA